MVRALLVSAALLVISPAAAFYGKKVDLTPVHPHAVPDGPAVLFASFAGCTSVATCSPGWRNSNDPVMGGQSKSTFALDQGGSGGMFAGTCAVVPFLKAPGFCKVETTGGSFPDASAYFSGSLAMRVRSTTPTYAGFKVAFGATGATRPAGTGTHHGGATFKAPFQLRGSGWQVVKIPFSQFSIDWSDYTGSCSTKDPTGVQHHCCTAAHPEVCVQLRHLKAVTSLGVWAEGVEGTFDLDIDWIGADESADVGVSQD